jgi:hypothetical protein
VTARRKKETEKEEEKKVKEGLVQAEAMNGERQQEQDKTTKPHCKMMMSFICSCRNKNHPIPQGHFPPYEAV